MGNVRNTPGGYNPFEVCSALQKCIRRGIEYDAYWWAEELVRNKQATVVWNRLAVIACEDVGMANPQATLVVQSCRDSWERQAHRDDPEWNILAFAVIYLCRSEKSRSADDLAHLVWLRKNGRDPRTRKIDPSREKEHLEIPAIALDVHTRRGKRMIAERAKARGSSKERIETRMFRLQGALLNKPVRDLAHDGVNWTEEVCGEAMINKQLPFAPATDLEAGLWIDNDVPCPICGEFLGISMTELEMADEFICQHCGKTVKNRIGPTDPAPSPH